MIHSLMQQRGGCATSHFERRRTPQAKASPSKKAAKGVEKKAAKPKKEKKEKDVSLGFCAGWARRAPTVVGQQLSQAPFSTSPFSRMPLSAPSLLTSSTCEFGWSGYQSAALKNCGLHPRWARLVCLFRLPW